MRLGGEYRQMQLNEFYWRHAQGSFTFDTNYPSPWDAADESGNPLIDVDSKIKSLANFLAGYMTKSTMAFGNPERTVYSHAFTLFGQDGYQVTPDVNVNFGLRYDFMQPMHNGKKDLSVFRPGTTATGIAFQGADIDHVYDPDYTSLSPRVGFSWSPKSSQGTVVRAGAGIFFDMPNANPFLDNRPGNLAPNGLEGNPGRIQPGGERDHGQQDHHSRESRSLPRLRRTSPARSRSPCGAFSVAKNFRSPYNINFSLQVERSLGNKASCNSAMWAARAENFSACWPSISLANGTATATPGQYSGTP